MLSNAEQGTERAGDRVDDRAPPTANPRAGWMTRPEVARSLGIAVISVRRRQAAGELSGELVQGQWLFPPEEVDALAETLEAERGPRAGPGEAGEAGGEARTLFGAAVCLVRQAEAHNERMIALIEGPASRLLQQTTAETGELRKRIGDLERKHTELLEASQSALDRAHERQLAHEEQQARLAMRFEAMNALRQWAPLIAGRVLKNRGNASASLDVAVQSLVSSLTPEQVIALHQSGVLSEAQLATLMTIAETVAGGGGAPSPPSPPESAAGPPPTPPPAAPAAPTAPPTDTRAGTPSTSPSLEGADDATE